MNAAAGSLVASLPESLDQLLRSVAGGPVETVILAYLDSTGTLLGTRHARGSRNTIALAVRDVVRDVLTFDARWVLMAHNHPSGDPRASHADLTLTRRLVHGLDAVGGRLLDHLVLGSGGQATSLRAEGWL